jgi:hypothetical protein
MQLGRQGKRSLNTERPQQSRGDPGKAPLRYGHAVGHKSADQQYGQVDQRELRGARHSKRSRLAKLADDPGP